MDDAYNIPLIGGPRHGCVHPARGAWINVPFDASPLLYSPGDLVPFPSISFVRYNRETIRVRRNGLRLDIEAWVYEDVCRRSLLGLAVGSLLASAMEGEL